jgi:hypothetical protein
MLSRLTVLTAFAFALAGCKKETDLDGAMCGASDAAPTFSSSLPGGSRVDGLSAPSYQTFCGEITRFKRGSCLTANLNELTCRLAGYFAAIAALAAPPAATTDAQLQTTCAQAYNSCVPILNSEPAQCLYQATCTATVDEVVTCLRDLAPYTQLAISSSPTCDQLTVSFIQGFFNGDAGSSPQPASCATISQTCPQQSPDGGA